MSNSHQQNLLDILDRPNEPIFTPKGDNGVVFNVPDDYVDVRFKEVGNRFRGERVPIKPITIPTSLNRAKQLPQDELFSLFIPFHRSLAGTLIEVFVGAQSFEDMMAMIAWCRGVGNINSQMLNYAVNVAILNRSDTKNIDVPPLSEFFPSKYIDGQAMRRARQEAKLADESGVEAIPLEIPLDYTASDLDPEHQVAYFREDLGINLHHWHWHLVYPFNGPTRVIAKDRRGELFYYMHQQLIARYNFERFSNKLPRVTRLLELRKPLDEGYFPKLDSVSASRIWAARSPGSTLTNINRSSEQLKFDILDLERWRDRLYEAVQSGRITDMSGNSVQLTEQTGIDILGNLIEASDLSMNKNVYGDLHNLGHVAIAYCHDPDHRHLETFSVMGDSATAMRDPIFYRWHASIDDIFQVYKRTLPPYTTQQLSFSNIRVTGLEVASEGGERNEFKTFWQKSDANLTRGMDFTPRANVFARFTHLQHAPFEYRIKVNNGGAARRGTVRIFLAPRNDERGSQFLLNDQRLFMIELDKFVVNLSPGENNVRRRSDESSVTIPFERTFRNLETTSTTGTELAEFNYCGCGWPDHMLIPKGNAESLNGVLFVMITNYEDDEVADQQRDNIQCRGAVTFCGIRDSKYPDRKPMGFPFDRTIQGSGTAVIDTLDQFLTPNMRTQNVTITFNKRTVLRNSAGQTSNQQGRLPPGGQQRPNRPKSPNPRN